MIDFGDDSRWDALDAAARLKRLPDITFTTRDPKYLAAIKFNQEMVINVGDTSVRGRVIKVDQKAIAPGYENTGYEFTVTFQATHAPETTPAPGKSGGDFITVKTPHCYVNYHSEPRTTFLADAMMAQLPLAKKQILDTIERGLVAGRPGWKIHIAGTHKMKSDLAAFAKRYYGMDLADGHDYMVHDEIVNSRHVPAIKEKKPVKIRNKFYVAAPNVTTEFEQGQANVGDVPMAIKSSGTYGKWTRNTLKAAITHAEQMLEADPAKDHVAIVQIVRIVRRKKQPIVVETVK